MKTITNLTKGLLALAMVACVMFTAQAQDEEPALTLSGSVDAYFRYNLNATNSTINGGDFAPGSSFANLPGFSLGMVNLIAAYEGENAGFVADLVFGPRGDEAVFGAFFTTSVPVNQLYAYWNVSDAFTLTMGNFNTFLGYEVISPTANYNYSTSYMFSYGPFSHSGLKADIALGDASLMLGVFNPTDLTDFNPTGDYFGGAQLGVAGQYLNLLVGDEYFQIDYTGGVDISDATYLGINATYNNDLFAGAALYLQQSFSDDFSMGIRGEYFKQLQSDEDELVDPISGEDNLVVLSTKDASVIDLTLSANYSVGNLTFIPEFRVDLYSEDEIIPEAGEAPSNTLASFLLAAVYAF